MHRSVTGWECDRPLQKLRSFASSRDGSHRLSSNGCARPDSNGQRLTLWSFPREPSSTALLEKNESVLLQVPSVIVPETVNFLFNPSHKLEAKFRITDVFPYPFDLRLKK